MIVYTLFIFVSIFILFFILKKNKESFENVTIHIGNVFSVYYYRYFMSILKKEDFHYENNEKFIELFPKFIPFNEEIFNKLNDIQYENYKNYEDVAFWTSNTKEKQQIHSIMKPYINKIMSDTFVKNNLQKEVKYPIIHFRCADTPFVKHHQYYFQKYKYFKDALDSLPKFDQIIILSCNTHLSNEDNKKSCNKYVELLTNELEEYNPKIQCGTNVDDFISMFYAPAVISTQSSYSFMSGFFGNGTYIQPNFMDNNEECSTCKSDYKGYNIAHNVVNDYHNINEVYTLLS
jgi:hypothetical protein